jgi:hypothetical protein
MEERKFETLGSSSKFWKPESKGEVLEGEVVWVGVSTTTKFPNPKNIEAQVKIANGEIWTTPTHAVLCDRLLKHEVKAGDYIRITYQGEEKSKKGSPMRMYLVERELRVK